MSLPLFPSGHDPGPSFTELLRRTEGEVPVPQASEVPVQLSHGTTIVAIRYVDGVLMAGDRRAPEGYTIAHRATEKAFPADRHPGASTAGATGPRMEPVRLSPTRTQQCSSAEGRPLSLQ